MKITDQHMIESIYKKCDILKTSQDRNVTELLCPCGKVTAFDKEKVIYSEKCGIEAGED